MTAGEKMIGTDNQWMPFYNEKRPVIADLIVDDDTGSLEAFYGKKRVQKSSVIDGAYEATDFYENLGGKRRHLYFLATPIFDEKGEIIAAIETLQDVTRERELELSLTEHAETLKRELEGNIRLRKTIEGIIEGSPIPTFVIDRNHRVILWNPAFTELSGHDGTKMIGTDNQWMPFYKEKRPVIADLIVDSDLEGLEKFYGKKKVQKSSVIEGAYEATDYYENIGGKRRHLYFLAAPILDEKGEVIAAIETLQDVTREREMELSLKEYAETMKNELEENIYLRKNMEELFNFHQSILDSSPDRIIVLNAEGIVSYMSRDIDAERGLTAEKLKGKHFSEFIAPERREFLKERWEEIRQGKLQALRDRGRPTRTAYEAQPSHVGTPHQGDGPPPRPAAGHHGLQGAGEPVLREPEACRRGTALRRYCPRGPKPPFLHQDEPSDPGEKDEPRGQRPEALPHRPEGSGASGETRQRHPRLRQADGARDASGGSQHVPGILAGHGGAGGGGKEDQGADAVRRPRPARALRLVHAPAGIPEPVSERDRCHGGKRHPDHPDGACRGAGDRSSSRSSTTGHGIDESALSHVFNPFFTTKKYGTGLGLSQVKKIIDQHRGSIDVQSRKGEGTRVIVTLPAK